MPLHTCTYKFFCGNIFISLAYVPKSRIVGSYSNSMFKLCRNRQTLFQSGHTILHNHEQCKNVPIYLHPHQYLLLCVFLIMAVLVDVNWCHLQHNIYVFSFDANLFFCFLCFGFISKMPLIAS